MANVVIINKRRHKVTVGVFNAQGKLTERNLGPNERTEPMDASKVSPYTKQLAASRHLDIITVA